MKQEQEDKLYKEFPNLYGDKDLPEEESLICWGISVGSGWFDIIYKLSQKLEVLILRQPEEIRNSFRACQVKEKFGTLRFYMSNQTPEMADAIEEAERMSAVTCEKCGAPGQLREGGWLFTLCDRCHANRRNGLWSD